MAVVQSPEQITPAFVTWNAASDMDWSLGAYAMPELRINENLCLPFAPARPAASHPVDEAHALPHMLEPVICAICIDQATALVLKGTARRKVCLLP